MSRLPINSASKGLHSHSYDVSTLATLDLGQLVCVNAWESLGKDKVKKFQGNSFMRLEPQVFPAFGKVYLKTASFFVPEYQIVEYSDALHSGQSLWKGKSVGAPGIRHYSISSMFATHSTGSDALCTFVGQVSDPMSTSAPSEDSFDFIDVYDDASNPGVPIYGYFKFTARGRYFYKILLSCGIDMPSYPYAAGSTLVDVKSTCNTFIDVFCLLSYVKCYCDMFMNVHMYNSHPLVALLRAIHSGDTYDDSSSVRLYDANTHLLSYDGLYFILDSILLPHEQNMYTRAFNTPNSPLGTNSDMFSTSSPNPLSPVLTNSDAVTNDYTHTYLQDNANDTVTKLTGFGLNLLQSLFKFARRNNLSSRSVDRVLNRFGLKTENFKSNYVHKLQETSQRIDFRPVLSNSDTYNSSTGSGKDIGAYGGYAEVGMNIDFSYNCQDPGFIIILAWIQIVPMWIRGCKPFVLRKDKFDFYTPEVDGKAIRAIPQMEFTVNKTSTNENLTNGDKKVYGYTNIYDEYRNARDTILGDFVLDKNVRNYMFARDMSYLRQIRSVGSLAPQTNGIQYYGQTPTKDLTNPFQTNGSLGDRFYLQIDWNIEEDREVLPAADALDLTGSGDIDAIFGGSPIS